MHIKTGTITNWGRYPAIRAELATPANRDEVREYIVAHDRMIARGNGRCYGDAALSACVLSTLALNKVLRFDKEEGIVQCESGVLLSGLLDLIVPAGWFFHVTPGIKSITAGGAIASDVHGKNHPVKGCFSNWLLSFELMDAEGRVHVCSREKNSDLFWQTCGGMGWTGVILSATFRLMRLSSLNLTQQTVRAANYEALFRSFEEMKGRQYAAAWIDSTSSGQQFGRGAAFFAEHIDHQQVNSLPYPVKKPLNVPFVPPFSMLHRLTIRPYNEMYFRKNRSGTREVDLDEYFYPLDKFSNWNRLYGPRGFVQYQFCLPEKYSFDGMRRVLEMIGESGETPFLTVLKRHGDPAPEAMHSFPIRGYSLALDFPRTKGIRSLIDKLDDLVWSLEGKIYLTKDACSAPRMGRVDPRGFGESKFSSVLRQRLSAD
ncbi:MAG: FAD-binding oxidoreductase [Saprospiraceae bacterium]|nr:FAD-binding oxidoreductase [Saprospiraceae bacterium]